MWFGESSVKKCHAIHSSATIYVVRCWSRDIKGSYCIITYHTIHAIYI